MPNFKTNKDANPEGYTQDGSEFYGYGNQKQANGMPYASPAKQEVTKVTDDSGDVIDDDDDKNKPVKSSDVSVEDHIKQAEARFGEGVEVKQSQHQTQRDRLAKQAYYSISTPQTGGTIHDASQGVRSKAYQHADKYLAKLAAKKKG